MTARIIYSTGIGNLCPNCRRALRECVCPKGAPGAAKPTSVRVGRETKGRAGKGVTTITGLPMSAADIDSLAGKLKKRCGSGGTVRGGVFWQLVTDEFTDRTQREDDNRGDKSHERQWSWRAD